MNTRQYIFLGAIGAIGFVLAFGLGSFVNALTGTPLTGGLVNGIIVGVILTLGLKSVPKFGAGIIIWIVFSALAIPTITMGTPGAYKIVVGVFSGLIWDTVVYLFKRSNAGYILGSAIGGSAVIIGTLIAAIMLGLPSAEKLQSAIYLLLGIYGVMGIFSGWLGVSLYNKKLSHLALFKRLTE